VLSIRPCPFGNSVPSFGTGLKVVGMVSFLWERGLLELEQTCGNACTLVGTCVSMRTCELHVSMVVGFELYELVNYMCACFSGLPVWWPLSWFARELPIPMGYASRGCFSLGVCKSEGLRS
jgi:hypothetical protein